MSYEFKKCDCRACKVTREGKKYLGPLRGTCLDTPEYRRIEEYLNERRNGKRSDSADGVIQPCPSDAH